MSEPAFTFTPEEKAQYDQFLAYVARKQKLANSKYVKYAKYAAFTALGVGLTIAAYAFSDEDEDETEDDTNSDN